LIFSNSTLKTSNRFFLFLFTTILLSSHVLASANKIEILFTANINGVLKNCHCGNPSLGGLARIITIVEKSRQANPDLILIDGGDGFNPYSYPNLNLATIELFSLLQPSILVPGDQEWVEGRSFLSEYIKILGAEIILSNAVVTDFPIEASQTIKITAGSNLHFLSYLDKNSFDLIPLPDQIKLSEVNFLSSYKTVPVDEFLVVIYHGPEQAIKQFIAQYPDIDLILLAHAQSKGINLTESPAIISTGTDGEFVQKILLNFTENEVAIEVQSIPVSLDIQPNPDALEIIKKWKIR